MAEAVILNTTLMRGRRKHTGNEKSTVKGMDKLDYGAVPYIDPGTAGFPC
jgi:hypothetical protein